MRGQEQRTGSQAGDRDKARGRASSSTSAQRLLALQRAAGNAAVSRAVAAERHQHSAGCGHDQRQPAVQRSSLVHQVLGSAGRPLDSALGGEMSARFGGVDFSSVRVHTDAVAQRSAAEIGASAYTSGSHVVWNGRDKHTLAHELTHVIQQSQGPVAGTDNGGGLRVSDPSDSYERAAEANATRVMTGPAPVQRAVGPQEGGHEHDSAVQAHGGDDHAGFVQRAAVGFEFQQLNSEVEVDEDNEYEEPYQIPTQYYGQHWYVVQDGDANLEFVTHPFTDMRLLDAVMSEISRVAQAIYRQTRADQSQDPEATPEFELGNEDVTVIVTEADNMGQPQVNPDVPLDALPGMNRLAHSDDEHSENFYGVDGGYWRSEETQDEMSVNAAVAAKILKIKDSRLIRYFKMSETATAEQLASVRGMFQAMASAAVHLSTFPTRVEKDMPLLLKTDMGTLWNSLVDDEVIGDSVDGNKLTALLKSLHDELAASNQVCRDVVHEVMSGRDPVWPSGKPPVDIGRPVDEWSGPTGDRKQVLVELRRVPIIPVESWPIFAANSYEHFISDPDNHYHRAL
ncbi:DUF4157 domain-containing protein [Streptomyces sp. NPDC059828]|uniref:eCIS core domain-containing protein n=1 Tax=Streptomyces sp. NPDC059828 TaxID=3346965 RepID=UPI003657A162